MQRFFFTITVAFLFVFNGLNLRSVYLCMLVVVGGVESELELVFEIEL